MPYYYWELKERSYYFLYSKEPAAFLKCIFNFLGLMNNNSNNTKHFSSISAGNIWHPNSIINLGPTVRNEKAASI
jgi:hypothetical protein